MEEKTEFKKVSNVKRNVTIAVVMVCICAAVYLNWSYNNQRNTDSVLSDASLASAKAGEEAASAQGDGDYISEYFAQARLTRQQARDEALALLEAAAISENASEEAINGAMSAITAMATYSMQETQIENIILAKGFADCVVFMSSEKITIAVPAPDDGLTADQVARITDAILTETSYNATQITVIEVKKPSAEPTTPSPESSAGEDMSGAADGDDTATQGGYVEDGVTIYE